MNLEKFTERARGFLQAAQTIAMREGHQQLVPEHLLKAILDDEQGMAANLISAAGGAPENPGRIKELRRTIARIKTIQREEGDLE